MVQEKQPLNPWPFELLKWVEVLQIDKAAFIEKIISALASADIDYSERLAFIKEKHLQGEIWRPASVLLILECYPKSTKSNERNNTFTQFT